MLAQVDPKEVWADYFTGWEAGKNVRCPFHDDEKPSLSLSEDGAGYCHGCGWKCTSVAGFVSDHDKVPLKRALKRLRFRYVGDVVPAREWNEWHQALLKDKERLQELLKVRGITKEAVKHYKLGWHKKRLTIPIFDELDCCVNVRMHDALRLLDPETSVKMVSYSKKDEGGEKRSFGSARLYPLEALDAKHAKVYLFEGELNTILARIMGLNAVCVTSGARVWKEEFVEYFQGRKVVVCQDVNDPDNAGQAGAEKKCKALAGKALWVKNVKLPIADRGGDLIDYVVKHGHRLEDFLKLEQATPYYAQAEAARADSGQMDYSAAKPVSLKEAAHTENFGKPIKMQCLVASMDLAPYVPPKDVTVKCLEFAQHQAAGKIPPKCGACWMPEAGLEKKVSLKPEQREMIAILDKNDQRVDQGLRRMVNVPPECLVEFKVDDVHNVHTVGIIPDVGNKEDQGRHDYVLRNGYYFGKHMEANKPYEFTGFSMSHPDTQLVTHVFVQAKGTLSAIERYSISDEAAARLDSLFGRGDKEPYDKLMEIYDDFSRSITKIVKRPLLHAAVDLVWHSPLQFSFNGERLHKGWLEAIVFGDTRCGKGYVAEGLSRYYGLGEVVSGENCSVAGLVGGLETLGRRLVLRWGAVPLNDRGLVIIDEMGDMAAEILGRMSRIRSEGVAEVTKIGHHQKTLARTRLIWLGNPREGVMADYTYGVQALQGMVTKAEDIARFDYAFAVADGEVPASVINSVRGATSKSAFPAEACRELIHWAWSRKPEQVQFTDNAVKRILEVHSKDFARKYSAAIPLVQGQNIRVKLAKVSAAVAARLFSHPRGNKEVLRVDAACVDAAAQLLDEFYSTQAMGYDSFSRKATAETTLSNESELRKLFKAQLKPRSALSLVRCLLSRRISVRAIAASASMDKQEAEQVVLDVLLRCNAVQERPNGYFALRSAFKLWLEKLEQELEDKVEFGGQNAG